MGVSLRISAMLAESSMLHARGARVSSRNCPAPRQLTMYSFASGKSPRWPGTSSYPRPRSQGTFCTRRHARRQHHAHTHTCETLKAHRQPPTLPTHLVTAPPFLRCLENKTGKGAYACGEAMSRLGKKPEPGCPDDKPDHSGPAVARARSGCQSRYCACARSAYSSN